MQLAACDLLGSLVNLADPHRPPSVRQNSFDRQRHRRSQRPNGSRSAGRYACFPKQLSANRAELRELK